MLWNLKWQKEITNKDRVILKIYLVEKDKLRWKITEVA